ncbi:MAG: hypothetical protein H6713_38505 [Myxococcales bacterium]|nr:hypothetical protein [Myxococcales bacterium]MCB9755859.1 hypothetical protein [Myxococcales bacterium]
MTDKDIRGALERARAAGRKVRLTHRVLADFFNGFVLDVSDDLVYLRILADFRFDDFAVLRLADIEEVRSGPNERFFERVLRAEGRLDALAPAPPLELRSFTMVLAGLLELDPYVTIDEVDGFHVGRLERVEDEAIHLRFIQVKGTVEPAPRVIAIDSIYVVTSGGDYLAMFRKYGRWEPADE